MVKIFNIFARFTAFVLKSSLSCKQELGQQQNTNVIEFHNNRAEIYAELKEISHASTDV